MMKIQTISSEVCNQWRKISVAKIAQEYSTFEKNSKIFKKKLRKRRKETDGISKKNFHGPKRQLLFQANEKGAKNFFYEISNFERDQKTYLIQLIRGEVTYLLTYFGVLIIYPKNVKSHIFLRFKDTWAPPIYENYGILPRFSRFPQNM